MHNLNPAQLESLPPGWHSDGGGLFLAVTEAGSRSWVVKYTIKGTGKPKPLGLGGLKDKSLKQARIEAEKIRTTAREGRDPRRALQAEAEDNRVIPTFGQLADTHLPTFVKGLKSQKTVEKWQRDLQRYAAAIRDIRVDKITTTDVLKMLAPHYDRAPSMARELRQRVERVLSIAMVLPSTEAPYRPRSLGNPATLKDNLQHLIPKLPARGKQKGSNTFMPYAEVPAFMPVLRGSNSIAAKCLTLIILTALRTNEARELVWDEVDLDHAVIKLDKRRMKNNLDAEIPLSPPAVAMLREMEKDKVSGHVFPGRKIGEPISVGTMLAFLKRGTAKRPDCTVHGFRTSFRSWGDDVSSHSRDTLEFCLHHIEGGEAERAYRQGKMLEKRRAALTDWASYILPGKPTLHLVA
jgi:integrase